MAIKPVVKLIDLELIDGPVTPLRELIDAEKVRELAESIRSVGLQNPVVVRRNGERFEIVSGHRRYLAHRLLGEKAIACLVKDLDESGLLLARAIENIQREDLSPLETARVYQVLRDKFSYSMEKTAQVVGKNKMTVWKYLQLLELPEDFQGAVDKGLMSMAVAVELMKVDDPEFRKYYLRSAVQSGITLPVAQIWVSDYERSRMGKYYSEGGSGGVPEPDTPNLPTYLTCFACHGSVDVKLVRNIGVCSECYRLIAFARAPQELTQVGKEG